MNLRFILILIFIDKIFCPNMDPIRASITREEQWAFIKLHYLLEDTAAEIHHMLDKAARSLALSRSDVYYIYNQFRDEERKACEQILGAGRPRTATDEETTENLRKLLLDDRNWSTLDYADYLNISPSSVKCILRELHARKVCTRWVPHSLNPVQKQLRVEISQEHLNEHSKDPTFLERIIAIDETYVKSYDPKDIKSAKEWRLPEQEP